MTHDRDIERVLGQWLGDGPTEVPDRVIDVVADRIGRQSQRPAWRFPRRELHMPTYPRIAAALAAIAIVAIGGLYLFGQPGGSGVGGPTATPSPSPSAISTPTASPTQLSSFTFTPRVLVQAPAGWSVDGDGLRSVGLKPPVGASGPGAGSILVMSGPFVDVADADCDNRPAVGVGASSAELVAAFSSDPIVTTTSAATVDVGGLTGQILDIQLAPTWTGTCDWGSGKPAALLLLATAEGPGFGLGGTEPARLVLVDVGGKVVAIIVRATDGTTQAQALAQAMPVVEAIQFIP
jgi:hypothetical protein